MKKENLNQKKGIKGITLVALVVTIVVLLILAGITITMLFSDSGIITKAREAADSVDKSQGDTLNGLNDLEDDMKVALGAAPKLKEQGKLVPITTKFAKYTDSTSSDVVPIPGGYGVVGNSSTGEENTIASGLVISDLAGDTLDNNANEEGKRGNQFVWVPVNDEQFNKIYDATNKRGNLYDFGSLTYNSSTYSWNWTTYDEPQLKEYSETSCREPDILRGADYGDASTGTVNTDFNGIVQLKNVVGISTAGTEPTENGNILKNWEKELQDKFDEMIESVKQYKGFYIGRYETQGMTTSNTSAVPTIQKGVMPSTNMNWYYHYQESKNIGKENKNVTSSMIWGCQFDRTLEWIVETNLKEDGTKDYELIGKRSNTWGNYKDSEGDAKTNSGTGVQTSGTNPAWQKNHIYDLAGNAWDWTLEAVGTNVRVFRGGHYNDFGSPPPSSSCPRPAYDRFNGYAPTFTSDSYR